MLSPKPLIKLLALSFAIFHFIAAGATNYFVSPRGNDGNSGISIDSAFQTLNYAAGKTAPGDTVFVLSGVYTNPDTGSDLLDIYNSGTPDNWIVYTNYPGDTPVIRLYANWNGIASWGAHYIVIDGFTVIGNSDSVSMEYAIAQESNADNPITSTNGIILTKNYTDTNLFSHHITIRNCNVSKCPGGGIGSNFADYVTVEHNTVSGCSFYSPYGDNGISLWENRNSDSSTALKNYILNNTVYNNWQLIPTYTLHEVTDGNGIIIDDSRNTQTYNVVYKGKTYIANNVVFGNGGRGIHCYESDHVTIVNNTCYKNCLSPYIPFCEFDAYTCDSIVFVNNISVPDSSKPPIDWYQATHLIMDHNLWPDSSSTAWIDSNTTNTVLADPGFVYPSLNPDSANFHLLPTSAAIGAGTWKFAPTVDHDYNPRSLADSIDIGAYAYLRPSGIASETVPAAGIYIYPNPAYDYIRVTATGAEAVIKTIDIFDINGNKVPATIISSSPQSTTANTIWLTSGFYLAQVKLQNGSVENLKFVKP